MAYLNLLNSRNDKEESSEILLSYLKERNKGILIGSAFLTLSSLILISLILNGLFLEYRKKKYSFFGKKIQCIILDENK